MKKKSIFLILFLLCLSISVKAQENETDTKLWTAVMFNYVISEKWSTGVEQHFRFKDNAQSINKYISELNTDFKPGKRWKFDAAIRYTQDRDDKGAVRGFDKFFRYSYGIQKGFKFNEVKFKLKATHQVEKKIMGEKREELLRLRPSLDISIRNWKWDPSFFVEYFHPISENLDSSVRFGVGTERKVSKGSKIRLKYFLSKKNTEQNPRYNHVFVVRYALFK